MGRRAVLALLLLFAPPAFAQIMGEPMDQYENRYGEPVDVSISDLVQSPDSYDSRTVRTHGRLDMEAQGGRRLYSLRDTFGARVMIAPMNEIASEFDTEGLRMIGGEMIVTG